MPAPADRVQLRKNESAAGGGDAADDDLGFPALLNPNEDAPEVQGLFLQPPSPSVVRDKLVWITRDGSGNLLFRDVADGTERTLSDLVAGAGGLTILGHRTLRQLIHFIDNGPAEGFASGAYREIAGTVFPSAIIWWDTSSKVNKIVEKTISYTSSLPTTIVWKMYDTDGSTVLATVTDAINYSGVFETNRTRTIA